MVECLCKCGAIAVLFASTAFAQLPISLGVRVGAPLGGPFKPYIFGPTVEVRFPIIAVRVIADALYTRIEGEPGSGRNVWEVPIMARLEARNLLVSPFIGAGPAFRWYPGFNVDTQRGFAVGGGVRVSILLLKLTPEIRYTKYGENQLRDSGGHAQFLLGITF